MKYGSLKTVFMQTMKRLGVPSVSLHDFAESIDSAELFLATHLPQDVVRDLMIVESYDVHSSNTRAVTKPANMLKLESARVASVRVSSVPTYVPATVVGQKEFLSKADYSSEYLVSEFNGYIGVNPAPAAAVTDYPGSVEFVYRKRPKLFMSAADSARTGALLTTLDQTPGNPRLFSTTTLGVNLESLGIDIDLLVGGYLVIPYSSTTIGQPIIDQAWTDGAVSYVHVTEDSIVPASATGSYLDCYILHCFSGPFTGSSYAPDSAEPDLPEEFHPVMLDIAIGKFLMSFKPQEAGQYINYASAVLQAYSVDLRIEFGGSE